MRQTHLVAVLIGLSLLGERALATGQPACLPLPPPGGTVVEVVPSQAGQLKNIIDQAAEGTTVLLHDGFYDMSGGGSSQLVFTTPGVALRSFSGDRESVVLDGPMEPENWSASTPRT